MKHVPKRFVAMLWVGAPVVSATLAIALAAGCTTVPLTAPARAATMEREGRLGPSLVVARFPAPRPKRSGPHLSERGARTLPSPALAASLFSALGRSPRSPSGEVAPFGDSLGDLLGPGAAADGERPLAGNGLCPPDMASINDAYCVDRYEASLVEILPNGEERPWSPYATPAGGELAAPIVRAVAEAGVVPQGYVSGAQAQEACARSGKRLCKPAEWRRACMGPEKATYGYGPTNEPRRCNDSGRSPIVATYGGTVNLDDQSEWNHERMNDGNLNRLPGTVAPTGSFAECTNGYGVFDMVGNLHEWVDDPNGTFQGGYYLDTHLNGDGCQYRTTAHEFAYHDYSTGFRCCADVGQ